MFTKGVNKLQPGLFKNYTKVSMQQFINKMVSLKEQR